MELMSNSNVGNLNTLVLSGFHTLAKPIQMQQS